MRLSASAQRLWSVTALALLLGLCVLASLVATGIALVRLEATQVSLGENEQESLLWPFMQAEREVQRVALGLARLDEPADAAARAAVVLYYEIALGRMELIEASPMLAMGPRGEAMGLRARAAAASLVGEAAWFERLAEQAPSPAEMTAKLARLDRVLAEMRAIANLAAHSSAEVREALRVAQTSTFRSLVTSVAALLGTLTLAGVVLGRQYRGLAIARRAAEAMGERLRAEAERAEAATLAKSTFLATMSHEIRTPMNGVLGSVSLLTRSRLLAEQARLVETIETCGVALLALIDDVLDISRLESGRVELEDQPYDPRALVEQVAGVVAARVAEKRLEAVVAVAPEVPAMLLGDAKRLRQILLNLLSNAVKFTDHGWVGLTVEAAEGRLRIAVRDSGIGIDAAAQATLFEEFSQADSSINRRFGGTGLGLAICRRLAEAMGGRVGLESRPGHGSVFTIEVPLRGAAEPGGAPGTADGVGREVAIAGPQGPLRAAIEQLVGWMGWRIAPEAATVLALPGTGPQVEGAHILRLGAVAAVRPPYSAKVLEAAVARAAGDKREAEAGAERPARALRVLVAEDGRVNQEVIRGLLEHLGHQVTLAGDGEAAVAAVAAAGGQDFDLVLMDMQMPRMDGLAATRAIRALAGAGATVPIVALTANSFEHDRSACLAAGMDGFMAKPVTLERLGAGLAMARTEVCRTPGGL